MNKYPPLQGLCKDCLGCMRLEDINFRQSISMQMGATAETGERNKMERGGDEIVKQINGQFIGKTKVSLDSKYVRGIGLDEDIKKNTINRETFKREMETAIDLCYEKNVGRFKQYETAIDILQETLREKFVEYGERL